MKILRCCFVAMSLVIGLLLANCGTQSTSTPQPTVLSRGQEAISPQAKPVWEEQWNKIVAEAKKESKIVILSGANPKTMQAIKEQFQGKYGIEVEHITGRPSEFIAKLLSERRAGLFLADIYLSGASNFIIEMKPNQVVDKLSPLLLLPEVVDSKVWWKEVPPFLDRDGYCIAFAAYPSANIAVNTNMVKPDEIKSFNDFLNPKWKGKIVMYDPSVPGGSQYLFQSVGGSLMSLDYWRDFVKQEPIIQRDKRLVVEWVARGKYPIGIGTSSAEVQNFVKEGAPLVGLQMQEGTHLSEGSGAIGVIKNRPHPNATTLFLNWLLSKEGQTLWTQVDLTQSRRLDTPTEHLNPIEVRQPTGKYVVIDEGFLLKGPEYITRAKEIFAPLLK